jgi:hypothetical protein
VAQLAQVDPLRRRCGSGGLPWAAQAVRVPSPLGGMTATNRRVTIEHLADETQ